MKKTDKRSIGYTLRKTSNSIKNYIDQSLQQLIVERLTGIEGMTMGFIFHHKGEKITAGDIMLRSHVNKATTSQTLNGLVKKGYIEMNPDKNDKRVKLISLTKLGEEINKEFDEAFKKINAKIENGLQDEDKENLYRYLEIIEKNIS